MRSTPMPDSTRERITGMSWFTITGASPRESSSMRMNFGWETSACASTTICCSPPDSSRACTVSRWPSRGNSSRARARPSAAACLDSVYVATLMLSSTDRSGSRRRPSGTIATPAARIFSGRLPASSTPSSETEPGRGRSTPPTARTREDLPAPFGPSSAVTSPDFTLIDTSLTTGRPPRSRLMPESSSDDMSSHLRGAEVGAHHVLVPQHRRGRPRCDQLAEVEHRRRRADRGDQRHVVIDEDGQRPGLLRYPADDRGEVGGLLVGQAGRRLVEQDQPGLAGDGAGDLDETTLAGGQRADLRPRRDAAADELDRVDDIVAAGRAAQPRVDHRDVVVDGQVGDRLLGLERPAHPPA